MRVPFADLLGPARKGSWSLDELGGMTGCGQQCGLCRPYLRRMLSDGTTIFHEVIVEEEPD